MSRHNGLRAVAFGLIAIVAALSSALDSRAAVEFVADVQLPNCWAAGVALKDSYLLTAGSEETKSLWILDVSDPTRPSVVSTWGPYYGFPMSVAVQGDYAYVCDAGSLLVLDISTISDPTHVATLPAKPPGWPAERDTPRAFQVHLRGDYAYLASSRAGVSVVDISDPLNPVMVGVADVPGETWEMAINGDYAYLAAKEGGLQIVSVADPANPTRVAEYRPVAAKCAADGHGLYRVVGAQASGSLALALSYDSWEDDGIVLLTALDVSDPASPQVLGQMTLPGRFGEGYYNNCIPQISGNTAFVLARDSLTMVDVSVPSAMAVLGTFSLPAEETVVYAEGVGGEWVPRTVKLPGPGFESFHYDQMTDVGYLIDGFWGVWVLDMANISQPVLLGAMPTAGEARWVQVCDDRVYLTDYNAGLFIFDISDPTQPKLLSQYHGHWLHGFHTDGGGILYIPVYPLRWPPSAGNEGRILLVDVSNPALPREVASIVLPELDYVNTFDVGYSGTGVFVFEDRLYVTHRGELFIYTAGEGSRPLLSHISVVPEMRDQSDERTPSPLFVRRVADEVLCYIASNDRGLSIVDVTDGGSPSVVGTLGISGVAVQMIDVEGDHAYVPRFTSGVWVIDVSDPAAPTLVADFGGPGSPMGSDYPCWVDADGATAWVADYSSGVYEWDISDPTNPTMVGDVIKHTSVNQFSVAASGGYLYRADVGALEVYRILP